MSHLTHEVCGVDFFLAYNKCSQNVIDLIGNLKLYLNSHRVTHFSNDYIDFDSNYLENFQLQAIRCKIFLFFIDKYALECEWFLNLYTYAKEYSLSNHLPFLIPVIFDDELDADFEDDITTKHDKNLKLKYIRDITKDCIFSINMSEISSFRVFIESLREAIVDIIPIKDEKDAMKSGVVTRFVDNKRPLTVEEENFFEKMKVKEVENLSKLEISRVCMRYILPKLKTYVALSVPYSELNSHITTMLNVQCHLIWIDCIVINKNNFFNFIWQNNDESFDLNSIEMPQANTKLSDTCCFQAKPPSHLIFFDLNTAQLAHINHKLSEEDNWSIELVDSYVKTPVLDLLAQQRLLNRPKTGAPRPQTSKSTRATTAKVPELKTPRLQKSYDEIFYICQFKRMKNSSKSKFKLQQSIIDTRYDQTFKEIVKYSNEKPINIPIRSSPLLVNVNTMSNKHFYFTNLYMSYKKFQPQDDLDYNDKLSDLKKTSLYYTSKNLNDLELMEQYTQYSKSMWRLVDLNAYKDENSMTKFSTIWSSLPFYEGTCRLFIGMNKEETLDKIDQMALKGMYPKLVTGYCYSNTNGEHLYALFFCQF